MQGRGLLRRDEERKIPSGGCGVWYVLVVKRISSWVSSRGDVLRRDYANGWLCRRDEGKKSRKRTMTKRDDRKMLLFKTSSNSINCQEARV